MQMYLQRCQEICNVGAMSTIERAVGIIGSQSAIARLLGGKVRPQHVSYWVSVGRVPAEHCRAIEAATDGRVTRYQLRPDVFGEAPEKAA